MFLVIFYFSILLVSIYFFIKKPSSKIAPQCVSKQIELTEQIPLLNKEGKITQEGWSRSAIWDYKRKSIHAKWFRIKEWEYYAILSHDKQIGLSITLSDLGYAAFISLTWFDFKSSNYTQYEEIKFFTKGNLGLKEPFSDCSVEFKGKKIQIKIEPKGDYRIISLTAPKFQTKDGKTGLMGKIQLYQDPEMEYMSIATSWKDRKKFYYNNKVNNMTAAGELTIGKEIIEFTPTNDFACLDWGRGNWTYNNCWYWGSASGLVDGVPFGFNLGYGFSDRTPATENCIMYDGKVHKLDQITFHLDNKNYLKDWTFTSNNNRLNLTFKPLLDRSSDANFLLIRSKQHQVFGTFSGTVELDNGKLIEIKNFLGFAEQLYNRW
ncbi:hypothetical protein M0812_29516 [Anaeramoeba flamelloides]|uniref:DUF2804 domain-containing protein n=1 Tax=Anaeramoeba flamelloides TaxID=1746091 RepID=A0AAV7Y5I6_9EUKA|nr:hypothetical protein M0812_29516 [Anaeramoeba flamelloides]